MSFMSRLKGMVSPTPVVKPVTMIPAEWMPKAKMKRVILHWTAGSYIASALDREHYHFLIEGDLDVIRGLHPVSANENIAGKSTDHYAAHTRACNTGSIGISICASAGAVERPFDAGKFPVKEGQWQRAAEVVALLCKRYDIPVTDKTVLTHAEVQDNLGIWQRGKWDIAKLLFGKKLVSARACGDDFRARVAAVMETLK